MVCTVVLLQPCEFIFPHKFSGLKVHSIYSFLLKHKGLALPALQICLEAFTWTDGESMTKVSSFCAALVALTISTNSTELQQFVSKDLFSAIIQGLALESNAFISADLISLCRDIYIYLCDRDPTPRQVSYSTFCLPIFWDGSNYTLVIFNLSNLMDVLLGFRRFCSHSLVSNSMICLLLKKL